MTDTPHPADWAEYHAHMEDEDELDRLRTENDRLREDVIPTILGFLVLAEAGSISVAEALSRATKVAREALGADDDS